MIRPGLYAIALVALTLWAYQSVWSAEWVYEDRAALTSAYTTQATGLFMQRSLSAWTWRATSTPHAVTTPRAAHLVSLGFHFILGGLVGLLAWQLGLTPLGAWAAMAVWLLHPMTVELAAYTKARADEVALIGILIAVTAATGRWWRGWGLAGLTAGVLIAVGGKQAGIVVLLLVPFVIWSQRVRAEPSAPPWWVPALVAAGLLVAGVQWYGGLRNVVNADTEAGVAMATDARWWHWGFVQAGAVAYWAVATIWPAWMTPDADIDSLSTAMRLGGLGVLLGATVLAWVVRTRAPVISVSCGWMVLAVLPRLVIQTPRSYLNAAHVAVAFVGAAVLAGQFVEWTQTQWVAGRPSVSVAHL